MSAKRKLDKKAEKPAAKRQASGNSDAGDADKDKKPERCFWVYRPTDTYWPPLAAFGVDDYERVQRVKKAAIKTSVERSKHHYEKLNSAHIHVVLRERDCPVSFSTVAGGLFTAESVSRQEDWIDSWEDELRQREDDPEQYKEDNKDSGDDDEE